MSLDYLKEILTKGNEAGDKTARSKKLASEVVDKLLRPIEEKLAELSGPETDFIGGTSSTKPQFIAELRLEMPERKDWIPQLRFALENEKKNDAVLDVGVTIGQAWTDPKTEQHYPAHIRWGAWCLAADKATRVQGPLRVMNRSIEEALDVMTPRPVTNKPTATLSMVGRLMDMDELEAVDSYETLVDQIAQDLFKLYDAVTPEPEPEEEEEADGDGDGTSEE